MKVFDSRCVKGSEFKDVKLGECFLSNHNILYIKIFTSTYNAVNLKTGQCSCFNDNQTVVSVSVRAVIEDEGCVE